MVLRTKWDPNEYVDALQVGLTRIGEIEVSTVRLPKLKGQDDRFETCLFVDGGRSQIVATYHDRIEALFGHNRFVGALRFQHDMLTEQVVNAVQNSLRLNQAV